MTASNTASFPAPAFHIGASDNKKDKDELTPEQKKQNRRARKDLKAVFQTEVGNKWINLHHNTGALVAKGLKNIVKAKNIKPNGMHLYKAILRDELARKKFVPQQGTTMREYIDEQWNNLSDEVKKEWKDKSKAQSIAASSSPSSSSSSADQHDAAPAAAQPTAAATKKRAKAPAAAQPAAPNKKRAKTPAAANATKKAKARKAPSAANAKSKAK